MTRAANRTVLLTGATGLLGPYVAAALSAAGWRVRAALHVDAAPTADESIAIGPIGAATDWTAALAGVAAVVHLAARAHRPPAVQRAERAAYTEVNTLGTLALARSAAAGGVRHFVFMSSIGVHGSTTDGRAAFRETDPLAPTRVYGETKAAAEHGLRELSAETGMAVTAIRPPMVYGQPPKGSFRALVRAISIGMPLPFAAVANRRAFVAAENLASFVAFRLAQEARGFEPFIVADDEQVSTAEFIRRIAHASKQRALLFPLPLPLLKSALRLAQMPELIESTLGSLEVDTVKAHTAGWAPIVTQDEGLKRALGSTRPHRTPSGTLQP